MLFPFLINIGSIDAQQLDTVTVDCQLVQFPDDSAAEVEGGSPTNAVTDAAAAAVKLVPKAFLLSEFHALIAYEDRVRGVCLLNQQQVFEAEFDLSAGKVKGMSRDPISGDYFYLYLAVLCRVNSNFPHSHA